jgi:hypothetical protein
LLRPSLANLEPGRVLAQVLEAEWAFVWKAGACFLATRLQQSPLN